MYFSIALCGPIVCDELGPNPILYIVLNVSKAITYLYQKSLIKLYHINFNFNIEQYAKNQIQDFQFQQDWKVA